MRRQWRRSTPFGERVRTLQADQLLNRAIVGALRMSGLYQRGRRNAGDLRLTQAEFRFAHLPPAFHGYGILHLSDLHLGSQPELGAVWAERLRGVEADLVAITGDFQCHGRPGPEETVERLAPLLAALTPGDGVVAILGNHDEAGLVEALEARGVTVLVNESRTLSRHGQHIHVVGTDDVHCFYTPAAPQALARCGDGFRIALVHSAELADHAEAAGYALYLSGHTHGGQIALPGGRPLLTMLDRHRQLARGVWRHGRLQGHTSAGTGTGEPPVRFNTRPEATLIRLLRH